MMVHDESIKMAAGLTHSNTSSEFTFLKIMLHAGNGEKELLFNVATFSEKSISMEMDYLSFRLYDDDWTILLF